MQKQRILGSRLAQWMSISLFLYSFSTFETTQVLNSTIKEISSHFVFFASHYFHYSICVLRQVKEVHCCFLPCFVLAQILTDIWNLPYFISILKYLNYLNILIYLKEINNVYDKMKCTSMMIKSISNVIHCSKNINKWMAASKIFLIHYDGQEVLIQWFIVYRT